MKLKKRYVWNHPSKLFLYPLLKRVEPYTKLPFDALAQVWEMIGNLDKQSVPGAIVEMGSWNGGCGALMSYRTKKNGSNRDVWLFDSFEGLPELAPEDAEWAKAINQPIKQTEAGDLKATGYFKADEKRVHQILAKLDSEQAVHVVKGWFQDSLPNARQDMGPIALLRLDGDIYESTKFPLEALYDQVVPGGYVVIDDFHLRGCRQAIYEFFFEKKIWPLLINSPRDGRSFFRKP
ncbi:hypothetical protein COX00_00800 [Candidatus Uhrbacteria bacterium CG22_combo_CG10-13_8_21_14_all_47_17]|uniref:Macrocin O-methyltransferase n=1 Tax=Candidatus Uhrbacteria bacterium CG22_combo_CG10-13_8_21_14_all_47_17 TaxID=1975041 RepID=A0A2H0BV58_9BACT|nr:MAG: hypothetical protein COX00_00800 [Candidatus Uhrbacteria bacterium CG22_combo_CG10-13_8_21_14_all_47_17]